MSACTLLLDSSVVGLKGVMVRLYLPAVTSSKSTPKARKKGYVEELC